MQLEIRSVADQVYGVLLRRIVAGDLPPRTHLRQEALAEELGVSRTPLREALRRLASEGFVQFAVNHGATVADHDLSHPAAVRTARLHFEPATARLAAEVQDPEGLRALREARGEGEFHIAVARATGNPFLLRFAQMLWMPQPGADDHGDHSAIADAIEAGDADEAERLSRAHVAS